MTQSIEDLRGLLPCPFCGGSQARTIHIRDGRKVACICGACSGPEFHGPLDRPDAETRAIAAWNTRTPDPASTRALEEARALCADVFALWNDSEAWGDNASVTRLAGRYGPIAKAARSILSGGV